jgi:hypothetical protein
MAEKIEETEVEWGTPRGGPSLVDWDQALNGEVWKMVRGTDFRGKATNFAHSVYRQASKRGLKVRVKVVDPETVLVQAAPTIQLSGPGHVAAEPVRAAVGGSGEMEETVTVRGETVPAADVPVVATGVPAGENPFAARRRELAAEGGDALAPASGQTV